MKIFVLSIVIILLVLLALALILVLIKGDGMPPINYPTDISEDSSLDADVEDIE